MCSDEIDDIWARLNNDTQSIGDGSNTQLSGEGSEGSNTDE